MRKANKLWSKLCHQLDIYTCLSQQELPSYLLATSSFARNEGVLFAKLPWKELRTFHALYSYQGFYLSDKKC